MQHKDDKSCNFLGYAIAAATHNGGRESKLDGLACLEMARMVYKVTVTHEIDSLLGVISRSPGR